MNAEFIDALYALEHEKNISMDVLIEAIEAALAAAYKRNFGTTQEVRISIDRINGDINAFAQKVVVEEVEDPDNEISLEDAVKDNPKYKLGDIWETKVTPESFGRIAAQTAKQVVVQRIREAERGLIFDEFVEKEDEVVTASIHRIERNNVFLELGRTEGYLPPSEQMHNEKYYVNDRIKVYILEVRRTNRGPQIIVSRSHPGLVKRLFENEVPEIQNGTVEIINVAREAGQRTKMAVYSNDSEVDPIGACVGQRGIRVERVVDELRGEKIDIVNWSEDPVEFIANALSPAKVVMVYLYEDERVASVVVPDNHLSLAIGREGQNARLAAKLTGWKIDIKSQSQIMEAAEEEDEYDEEYESEDEKIQEDIEDSFEDLEDLDIMDDGVDIEDDIAEDVEEESEPEIEDLNEGLD